MSTITPLTGAKQVAMFISDARHLLAIVSRGKNEDWEECGKTESDLKDTFIVSVASQTLTPSQVSKVAKFLTRIINHKHPRWFS